MYDRKRKIYELVYYLLDNSYAWHLQYMQAVLIPSEIDKIIKEREKFNKSILERIVHLLEPQSSIESIKIYVNGTTIELESKHYGTELKEVKESLDNNENIKVESDYKEICISNYQGYEITYVSDYGEIMTNKGK